MVKTTKGFEMKCFTPIATCLLLSLPLHLQASPETDLCQQSEYGFDTCLQRLTAFLAIQPDGPLSDDELYRVYGCVSAPEEQNNKRLVQSIPGCP